MKKLSKGRTRVMKPDQHPGWIIIPINGILTAARTRTFVILAASIILFAALPIDSSAGDFILHPGYINGTVTIPDGYGGEHSIVRIQVSASGYDPVTGNNYSSSTTSYDNHFNLVVEGGEWAYTVNIYAYYDTYPDNYVRWLRSVIVNPDDTVALVLQTDGFINGTISVAGETVTQIYPQASASGIPVGSPQYGFYSRARFEDGHYRLPVVGGDANFSVYSGSIYLTDPDEYLQLGYKNTSVASGEEATVDFNVTPGYVEGTVSLIGASIDYGYIGAQVWDTSSGQWVYASTRFSADGTYHFPVAPGDDVRLYGHVYYSGGSHALIDKSVDVVTGLTTICNWSVTLDSALGGEIAVTGINLDRIYIYGYGPNGAYRAETIYSPGEYYEYDWDKLTPGEWGIRTYVWDYEYDAAYGIRDYDYYYFPEKKVELEPGGKSVVDFSINPGFIGGGILAEDSASIPELFRSYVYAYEYDYWPPTSSQERAYTDHYDFNLLDEHYVNNYDLFVGPGDWRVSNVSLQFRHVYPELGYYCNSSLSINELIPGSYYQFNVPLLTVNAGDTVENDFGYQTAQITARLRVATGEPLSNPRVNGYYLTDPDGNWDKSAYISGYSYANDVLEGLVQLHAVPGKYRLTAQAYVLGSLTTFGQPFEITVEAGDVVVTDPDAPEIVIEFPPGGYETNEVCVVVSGTITDESNIDSFTINGIVVTIGADGSFEITICDLVLGENIIEFVACDEHGNCVTFQRTVILINSPPIADLGGPYSGDEGSVITFDASGSSDPDGNPLQFRWDYDNDGTWDTDYSSDPVTTHTWDDDYTGTVVVEVWDGYITSTDSTSVVVTNVDPTITSITGPVDPIPVGTGTSLTGNFMDPGTLDTHTAEFVWGDGTSSVGTVSETNGSGTATGSHVYLTPGVYRVTLTVTDDDGGSDSIEFLYAVVYDPTGAFVTGGGQFDSPAGAYAADPSLTGKAGFGFVSKYQKGTTTPSGNTQFRFHAADLKFSSTSYQWLVVAGARAQFKGTGIINGGGNYGFMLTAIDGDIPGGGGFDKFRIKIWDKNNGDAIVYDNLMGGEDDSAPTTILTHGSINIHKD